MRRDLFVSRPQRDEKGLSYLLPMAVTNFHGDERPGEEEEEEEDGKASSEVRKSSHELHQL